MYNPFFVSFYRIVKKSRPALCPRSEYYCADNFYFDGQLCVGKKKTLSPHKKKLPLTLLSSTALYF